MTTTARTYTYTYTAADYRDVFGSARHGFVGVDPDGDLVWVRRSDIEWAYETVVLSRANLSMYRPHEIVFAPSARQKEDFDVQNGIARA